MSPQGWVDRPSLLNDQNCGAAHFVLPAAFFLSITHITYCCEQSNDKHSTIENSLIFSYPTLCPEICANLFVLIGSGLGFRGAYFRNKISQEPKKLSY
jgi:hypothetical protein